MTEAGDRFDHVIVGRGAADWVLCSRLTDGFGVTARVPECGPVGFIKMLFTPTYTWRFRTESGRASTTVTSRSDSTGLRARK